MTGRIRVFIATSLDGFIAGEGDDLSWLPSGADAGVEDTFTPFFAEVGAMLMGRRTFDVVTGFDGPWPYGETPVLVATRRPLEGAPATVSPVQGSIADMVTRAREVAGDRDVYLDGGGLIRQALDAGLVDELTLTVISVVLGRGVPLFAGVNERHALRLVSSRQLAPTMVELKYVPANDNE